MPEQLNRSHAHDGAAAPAGKQREIAPVHSFVLEPSPPFRLDLTAWALRRRANNEIDRWDGKVYRRTLFADHAPVEVAVRQTGDAAAPRVEVSVTGHERLASASRAAIAATLERLLGLRIELDDFYRDAARDHRLGILARQFRGLKPPRFPTLFETLVNAVACQQVTLTLGILLLNRLAQSCAVAAPGHDPPAYAFPRPEDLAAVRLDTLRGLGFSRQKSHALLELAQAARDGRFDEKMFAAIDDDAALARLCELRGVGRWSAEYTLLRGLGRLHVFPADDVGARNHLQRWLGLRKTLDYAGARRIVARWDRHAGLVYFHLLLKHLGEEGRIAHEEESQHADR